MNDPLLKMNPFSRRQFLETMAQAALGVTMFGGSKLMAADSSTGKQGKAKNVIYLFMNGAMSHLDTFDLKPGREVQGDTKPLKTKNTEILIGQWLPKISKQTDKLAIINSMTQETAAHEPGRYLMRTSYPEIASTRHPSMGAWAQRLHGKRLEDMPDNVVIGSASQHPGAGFLDPEFSPLPIGDPNKGLQNTKRQEYVTESLFSRRLDLISKFDANFQAKYKQKKVTAYNDFYEQATRLLESSDLASFDLNLEKDATREKYGMNNFGQGCLLARRLVENQVRFVEVSYGSWDHHRDIYETIPDHAAVMDQALSALLEDLAEKGLLDETLVVLTTEFGRTPKINANGGRDHHPGAFSTLLAGGGIQGGQKYGTSDEDGFSADENPVSVADFNATIAYAMGLDTEEEIYSSAGRPFKVAHDGVPIKELF
ncbi:MAG: hypothetical protein COA78_02385 [Blastopirellula sp.]|nr:MAG: hypothetical protein COA78_02385 [Blastopirellula sp.]